MLIRIITYTNFIVAALAILLVIISKDISAFRKAFSFAPLSLKGFIQATIFFRPNVFARFIVATFPFAFVWMRLRNSKFLTPIIIINAIGIISTVSVMGTLTFFIELIILLFFQKKIAKKSFFICVAILIIIPFLFIGLSWRFERKMSNLLEHGTGVRIVMYRSALEAIQDKPILGCGPGSAKYVINKSGEITEVSEQIWGKSHELTLHNSILSIAAEAGIPAAAFFLIGAISLIISSWKKTKKATSSVLSSIYLAGFLSTLTFFMSGMVFSNLAENIGWYGVAITIFILKAPTEMLQDFYV
ncbi:MAG: O-antigen ligase family protein [Candidatus Aminicenantes bacterium]|nr:MAG: O-antigen ligase family protein [Candidatus Aminicenantes bacterium]